MVSPPAPTRDRIVSAAQKLFYEEGIGRVGMDAVAAKAGVTKRTIYYHFASKDDLIAATLASRDQPNLALFKRWFEEAPGDAAAKVRSLFAALERSARHPKWRGCGFLRTSVELFRTPGHEALRIGRAHKNALETWLAEILASEAIRAPHELARQIVILLDGSFAVVLLHRDPSYMASAGTAAEMLIRAAPKTTSPG